MGIAHSFTYNGMSVDWTVVKNGDFWTLALSFTVEALCILSVDELNGIQRETGFEPCVKISTSFCRSSLDSQILCYYEQRLPEKPLLTWDMIDIVKFPANYEKTVKAMLTLDPEVIRKAIGKNISASDEDVIIAAHRCLALSPFVSGSRRLESVKWLHENGYHILIE